MEHKLFKIENFIKKDKDNSFNNNINLINNNDLSLYIDNNSDKFYNYYNLIHSININQNINTKIYNKEKSSTKKNKNIQKKILKLNSRSSKYRGVSKNGNKWQVHIMINKKNKYIGIYDSEEIAARIYDVESIKKNGLKAITNFKYNLNDEIMQKNFIK